MKIWRRIRDGFAAQYQGKKSFRGWKTMSAHHQMECEDTGNPEKHTKDIADGGGHAVDGMVKIHSTMTTGMESRTWYATYLPSIHDQTLSAEQGIMG